MVKQTMLGLYHEILPNNKKKQTTGPCNHLDESPEKCEGKPQI